MFKIFCMCVHVKHLGKQVRRSNRYFGLQSFQLLLGKFFRVQECLKTQSGEESSSSGHFNPVGHLQQSGALGVTLLKG